MRSAALLTAVSGVSARHTAAAQGAQAAEPGSEPPVIDELRLPGSRIELQYDPGFSTEARALMRIWIESAAHTVAAYFGRFPLPEVEILMLPEPNPGVHSGVAFAEPHPYLRMRVGRDTDVGRFRYDWVLVHEMVHLALPKLAPQHAWFHEGAATYVEAVARARRGAVAPAQLWGGLALGMRRGQPFDGDLGLDHTPTWGRTYWGGAMFCLLADVQIRQRSQGRVGLQQALQGVLAAGGNYAQSWPLQRVLAAADASVGQTSLAELYALMSDCPAPIDLEALWADLGVIPRGFGFAALRSAAPLVDLRRAIDGSAERSGDGGGGA